MAKLKSEIKETGIVMTGDHPRKIIDLLKTQTRRTSGLQHINRNPDDWSIDYRSSVPCIMDRTTGERISIIDLCPYGKVGDILRVKETWRTGKGLDNFPPRLSGENSPFQYKADMASVRGNDVTERSPWGKWRTSRFMPRHASRLWLEIERIRLQRLQDITESDAQAEGANPYLIDKLNHGIHYRMLKTYHYEAYPIIDHADEGKEIIFDYPNMGYARCSHGKWEDGKEMVFRIPAKEAFNYIGALEQSYRNGFRILWDSLNKKRGEGWDLNLWVWALTFNVIHYIGDDMQW